MALRGVEEMTAGFPLPPLHHHVAPFARPGVIHPAKVIKNRPVSHLSGVQLHVAPDDDPPDLAQNRHIEARASRADVLEDDPQFVKVGACRCGRTS